LASVHARHHDVGEQQFDLGMLAKKAERDFAVFSLQHAVSKPIQRLGDGRQDYWRSSKCGSANIRPSGWINRQHC
jgi:hypothetical protein